MGGGLRGLAPSRLRQSPGGPGGASPLGKFWDFQCQVKRFAFVESAQSMHCTVQLISGLRFCCVKLRILCEKHKIRNKTRQCMLLRNPTRSHKIRRNPNKTLQCMPFTKSFKILRNPSKSNKIQNPTLMYVYKLLTKSEQNPNKIPNSKSVRHHTSAAYLWLHCVNTKYACYGVVVQPAL